MVTFRSAVSASAPASQSQQTSRAWTCGFYQFSNRSRLGHRAVFDLFNAPVALRGCLVRVSLVICFSIWWQKSGKRSTSCYEERPALGNISSRPFNEARASVVTSGDSGGHDCGRIRRARDHKSRSGRRSKRRLRRSPRRLPSTRRANSNGMF
jgi:hypothetical protein